MKQETRKNQFSKRCLSAAHLDRIRSVGVTVVGVMLCAVIVEGVRIMSATTGMAYVKDHPYYLLAMVLQLALTVKMLDFSWLPDEECDALASLCERHPPLMAYRNKVCAAGRRFTMSEFEAMKHWAAVHEHETRETLAAVALAERRSDGRQRLYGAAQA